MRKGLLGSILTATAGAGLALGQAPAVPAGVPIAAAPCAGGCGTAPACDFAPAAPAGRSPRNWAEIEGLYYFIKSGPVGTPLLTTSTAPGSAGILGAPTTAVLTPDKFDYDGQVGIRGTAWTLTNGSVGVEVTGFLLERHTEAFAIGSDAAGAPVIARPFSDTTPPTPNSLLVAAPGLFSGAAKVASGTRLWGAEANAVADMSRGCGGASWGLLGGFRYLSLDEDLVITSGSTLLPGGVTSFVGQGVLAPAATSVTDRFDAKNDFYGGQVGVQADVRLGDRCFVSTSAKVALGVMQQQLLTAGTTTLSGVFPAPVTAPGGLFVTSDNAGRTNNDQLTVVPELGVKAGFQVNHWLSVAAGYNFLYVSSVLRPGDQIDAVVNPTRVPLSPTFGVPFGPARPAPVGNQSDFFAHGVSASVQVTY